jgi:GNAT superfamily N-acetyltransferase
MFTHRLAAAADLPALRQLMSDAIATLQVGFLTQEQIAASHGLMGLDTQLIADRTYFVALCGDRMAGCGGWSRRATLFGGDHTAGRDAALLDPARDPARVRAMYTAPEFARRGVGRMILALCEQAARADGFKSVELAATLAGVPLYASCGYHKVAPIEAVHAEVSVPLVRMRKLLVPSYDDRMEQPDSRAR